MPLNDCDPVVSFEVTDSTLTITVTLAGGSLTSGGVTVPALTGTWTPSANAFAAGIQFQYVPHDASAGPLTTGSQPMANAAWTATNGVIAGKTYDTKYRVVGTIPGTYGPWSVATTLTPSATLVASSVNGQAPAATDATIIPGATQNLYFSQSTDPALTTTMLDGYQWFNPSTLTLYARIGGAWLQIAQGQAALADHTVMFDSATPGAFSFLVPANALGHVDMYLYGGGGGAGPVHGGGGSGFVKHANVAVTAGTTVIAGSIGSGGRGSDVSGPITALAGGNTTCSTYTLQATGGGTGQTAAGAAGGASGGNTSNTTGEAGDTGGSGNGGANLGASGADNPAGGARKTVAGAGNVPGGGACSDGGAGTSRGANGRVIIVTRT